MNLRDSLTYEPVALTFGTSGLRGLVVDMTDLECYINAVGFLRFLENDDGVRSGATVYLAGDLRDSTPRIMAVMTAAIEDCGLKVVNCGKIPTPAVAYYALQHDAPCIMVTGSHIPADRNGIKFYKRAGEVMKDDEAAIKAFVAGVRQELYEQEAGDSSFKSDGAHKNLPELPAARAEAEQVFIERSVNAMPAGLLSGKKIVVYQQSAVGRDMLVTIVEKLGGEAVPLERSEKFIPIDTENITDELKTRFQKFAAKHPDAFATISTDGDSDRPFVIDETGTFHRGDVLGCVVADYLGAKFGAVPVSANDAVDQFFAERGIPLVHTKIGSPYVIEAMAAPPQSERPAVCWEVNGGFMTGSPIKLGDYLLQPLPTRDATLPILCALATAVKNNCKLSEVFAKLPARYTGAGIIDDVPEAKVAKYRAVSNDEAAMQSLAQKVFADSPLGEIARVDVTDGLRLVFKAGNVVHFRLSGNAPQFRVYTNANSQQHADELVAASIAPGGYIAQILVTF